jgi:hypothetical protein
MPKLVKGSRNHSLGDGYSSSDKIECRGWERNLSCFSKLPEVHYKGEQTNGPTLLR